MIPIKKGMTEAVTRDGRKVTQLTWFDGVDDDYQVCGVLDATVNIWLKDGKRVKWMVSHLDLFAPVEYEWQWLVKHKDGFFEVSGHYKSEDDLKNMGGYVSVNGWSISYRIEESKREVLTE